jgi:hypothetical protein
MDLYYPHITQFQELTLEEERRRQQRLELEATRGRTTWHVPRPARRRRTGLPFLRVATALRA